MQQYKSSSSSITTPAATHNSNHQSQSNSPKQSVCLYHPCPTISPPLCTYTPHRLYLLPPCGGSSPPPGNVVRAFSIEDGLTTLGGFKLSDPVAACWVARPAGPSAGGRDSPSVASSRRGLGAGTRRPAVRRGFEDMFALVWVYGLYRRGW